MTERIKILIIDDDRTVCSSLKLLLDRKGYEVEIIHSPSLVEETIERFHPSLILLDMNFTIETSGKQGLRLLQIIRSNFDEISVILMTGWATVQLAVEGMKIGAKDFIAKPWDNKELVNSIQNILQLHHLGFSDSKSNIKTLSTESTIVGNSQAMNEIMDLVERVAITDASVLITGESGTGKELIAEAIHNKSRRNEKSFVKVNLGGVPTDLFGSEMFGHKKGAFTGAHEDREGRFSKANKGTIFLDEIGELSMSNQVKMLRVLQEKIFEPLGSSESTRVDVRVISATNRNLESMAHDGTFREDLYYRINLLHIHLPSLSERRSDIPALVRHFISNIVNLYNVDLPYIDDKTYRWLSEQEYKGNIRQLKNIVERTFLLNIKSKTIEVKDFMSSFNLPTHNLDIDNGLNLEETEKGLIKKALVKYDHSISAASKALGITRSSLYRRLEKYDIRHEPKI